MTHWRWPMVLTATFAAASLTANGQATADDPTGWIFPGEFESHQALWMLWPTFEYKAGFPASEPMAEMIRALSGHTQVNLAVQDADDEAAASALLSAHHVPLAHVHFFRLAHGDIWARDTGPQFTRNRDGDLRINDWNFNMWGHEEPDSEASQLEETFDRSVARTIDVPPVDTRAGSVSGVRMIHEGGGVTHNGLGTMIAVESVVMQRNLGPNRFCGGEVPVTDDAQPNTYQQHPGWPACRARVEAEYRRMLGATNVIWIPTGVIEDHGTFRGPLGKHVYVPSLDGFEIPHSGVYTVFTTNGHADEFVRFVSPDTVVLAQAVPSHRPVRTAAEKLTRWLDEQNQIRLERAYDIVSHARTEAGKRIRVLRIPTPVPTLEVFRPGDGTYDYFAAYENWEDGTTVPETMLGVWAASYVNYVPTNDLVLVAKYWRPGRSLEVWLRDHEAKLALERAFPGREVVQIHADNINRGGGGMNCITQQQPASRRFSQQCGWSKVRVGRASATLYAEATGTATRGTLTRLTRSGNDIYLQRLTSSDSRVRVRVVGARGMASAVGWIDEGDIEDAGEQCPHAYALN